MLDRQLLTLYARSVRHCEEEATLARWKVGRYLNEEFGLPGPDEAQNFRAYPIPKIEMNQLKEIFGYSRTEISHWRRFHLRCEDKDAAQALIKKHGRWELVKLCGLRDRTEDEARAIIAAKTTRMAERNSGQLIIAIPPEFTNYHRRGLSDGQVKELAEEFLRQSVPTRI